MTAPKTTGKPTGRSAGKREPCRPRRSRRPAAETRQEILRAAEELFRQRGYQQVAMADIAAELEMSPANVFKHFHSKTALVDAIATAHLEKLMAGLADLEMLSSPQMKLLQIAERLLTKLLQDVCDNPHLFKMIVLTTDLELTAADLYREKICAIFEKIVLEGVATGDFFVTDPHHTASVIATALEGVIHPLSITREKPEILHIRCRDLIGLVTTALQNPLAK
ncbi:TetR/AcrR family transcriptional regulator [Agrobacterium vitis]|uniref:TetR family transcriptional regulator n=1 Tax=Agrobacterium vitis TaxID=373 RepID=A0AAE2RKK7_AGRVI|nr:TetR/AcrR family transcriptional regulator [Agrobacterium vitis]MBF2718207.1 TetR family transcriptional regulator [Agrobacterium vitis]MUZ65263.1 TetR family transcriptional regulator [Agrobacterium vitis]MVA22290.1 TetR family transcriptional regulator [Agrobacterium vitis]